MCAVSQASELLLRLVSPQCAELYVGFMCAIGGLQNNMIQLATIESKKQLGTKMFCKARIGN